MSDPGEARELPEDVLRARRRLAAQGRELEALQSLGRRAAEARTPDELVQSVVDALHRVEELDAALLAQAWDGVPAVELAVGRPFDRAELAAIEARARRFLGWSAEPKSLPPRELEGFDGARGPRTGFREEELVLLPLLRAGRPEACLVLLPSAPADEGRLRLLYGASNQLSLHLERLLTAREAEADRLRAIVDTMPQGVLLADAGLRVLQANPAARRLFADCGVGADELSAGLERLALGTLVEQALERGTVEGETRGPGDRRFSVTISCLPGGDGRLLFVLIDRTESRRLESRLAQAEKLSTLGRLISGVAHELNNPLATIIGYSQLLRGARAGDEKLPKRLETLAREAERCRRIVQGLLSFARQHEPERKPLSLNQVVEGAISLLGYQLRVDGIEVERELSRDLPAIEGDAHELEQVLVNLLTNAAHAIRGVSERGTVTLCTRAEPCGTVVLEIRDSGPGIPEEVRARIFEPFFTTKSAGQGTGLGLSLVQAILSGHGGTIEALGHAEPGTTFRITLPAARRERTAHAAAEPAPAQAPAGAGRVLVVDDDEAVAQLICEALERDGLTAERVRGAREALARLALEPFDAIVCDLKMPDMPGEQLWDALRKSHPALVRRVLWTTGDTLGAGPEQIRSRTGQDVLAKPFDLDELRRRVQACLAS